MTSTYFLHVHRRADGLFAGTILQPIAWLVGLTGPDLLSEVRERFPACADLPRDAWQPPQGHAVDMLMPTGGRLQVDAVPDGWTWQIVADESDLDEDEDPADWEGGLAHAGKPFDHLAQALAAGLAAAGIRGD